MRTSASKIGLATYFCMILGLSITLNAQHSIPLYPEGVPYGILDAPKEIHTENDILWITEIRSPSLQVFTPPKKHRSKKAVIICPGGGYHGLAYDLEGTEIAKWYNSIGITAFVLKYRMPKRHTGNYKSKIPLSDAARAMKFVRKNADRWNIDPNQIGIMGFSAGGHLASTLGTHYNMDLFTPDDPYEKISARPDFMILIYPVISMEDAYTHKGSMQSLLGEHPSTEAQHLYSSDQQVDPNTPRTFLIHCLDDDVVDVANSIKMFQSLQEHKVPSELHVFPKGGHGFGLAVNNKQLAIWSTLLERWLNQLEEN